MRIEERLTNRSEPVSRLNTVLPDRQTLRNDPQLWLTKAFDALLYASKQLLCSEDVDWFVSLCRQRGWKPVNFVPLIDGDLEYWFKKDSLWYSEDIEAVPDADVGRVFVLQGPVSCKYSTIVGSCVHSVLFVCFCCSFSCSLYSFHCYRVSLHANGCIDEPVADILNGIHQKWVTKLEKHKPSLVEYVGGKGEGNVEWDRLQESCSASLQLTRQVK